MAREQDSYDVYEAARVLGISPARVRKMLRAGELLGERREQLLEGVPGPWRLPAGATVHAARSVVGLSDAERSGKGAVRRDRRAARTTKTGLEEVALGGQ